MLHDITLTLTETLPIWPGDAKPQFKKLQDLHKGDIASVSHISMSAHTGTHMDAPCHFLKDGSSIEDLSLEILIGDAVVVETKASVLSKQVLEEIDIPSNTKRLLIKTRNSEQWAKEATEFIEDYVALTSDGAEYLVSKGVKLIGLDYLSIADMKDMVPVHEILLKEGVVILEAVNLFEIKPGNYTLYCLPMKIAGFDGAPARVVLQS